MELKTNLFKDGQEVLPSLHIAFYKHYIKTGKNEKSLTIPDESIDFTGDIKPFLERVINNNRMEREAYEKTQGQEKRPKFYIIETIEND